MNQKLKSVKLDLSLIQNNINLTVTVFKNAAKKAGWSQEEISNILLDAASSGDVDQFYNTLVKYCENK